MEKIRGKKGWLGIIIMLTLAGQIVMPRNVQTQEELKPQKILQKAQETYSKIKDMELLAVQEVTATRGREMKTELHLWFKAPNLYKSETRRISQKGPEGASVSVCDGKFLWNISPLAQRITKSKVSETTALPGLLFLGPPSPILSGVPLFVPPDKITENFQVSYKGKEKIQGTDIEAYILEFIEREKSTIPEDQGKRFQYRFISGGDPEAEVVTYIPWSSKQKEKIIRDTRVSRIGIDTSNFIVVLSESRYLPAGPGHRMVASQLKRFGEFVFPTKFISISLPEPSRYSTEMTVKEIKFNLGIPDEFFVFQPPADMLVDESSILTIGECQKRLEKEPNNANLHFTLGTLYLRSFTAAGGMKREEALKEFERVIQLKPKAPAGYLQLADTFAYLGKYEQVLKIIQQIEQKFPQVETPHFTKARALKNLGRYAEALNEYQKAMEEFGMLIASEDIAELYQKLGTTEEAKKAYLEALLTERGGLSWSRGENPVEKRLFELHEKEGKLQELAEILRDKIKENPKNPQLFASLGSLYFKVGEPQKGLEMYRRAAELTPETTEAKLALARRYRENKLYQEAENLLQEVISTAESDWHKQQAIRDLMLLYRQENNPKKIVKFLHKLLQGEKEPREAAETFRGWGFEFGEALQPDLTKYIKEELEINPREASLWRLLAYLEGSSPWIPPQRYSEIIPDLEKAIKMNPMDAHLWHLLGALYQRQVREILEENKKKEKEEILQKSVAAFTQAVKLDPEQTYYLAELAYAYNWLGDNINAVKTAKQIVRLDPESPEPHYVMGCVFMNAKHYTSAIEEFETAKKLLETPREGVIYTYGRGAEISQWLARCYQGLEQIDKAIEHYEKALESGSPVLDWRSAIPGKLILLYLKGRQYDKMLKVLEKAFKRARMDHERESIVRKLTEEWKKSQPESELTNILKWLLVQKPKEPYLYVLLGEIYRNEGKKDLTLNMYARAAQIAPEDRTILEPLAKLYYEEKQYAWAIPIYEKLISLPPPTEEIFWSTPSLEKYQDYRDLADCYLQIGNPKKALELAERMKDKLPKESETFSSIGDIYMNCLRYDEAIEAFQEAINFAPEGLKDQMKTKLAKAYEDKKDYRKAIAIYSEISETSKDSWQKAEALRALARIYKWLGQKEKAIEYLQKALDIATHSWQKEEAQKELKELQGLLPGSPK